MAISDGTAGAWVATTTRNPTVTLPSHAAGNMLLVRVGWKSSTPTTDVAVCNTSGWAKLGQYYDGGGTSSNGGGGVLVAVFWKVATSASETNPVIEFDDATGPTPGAYCAVTYTKGSADAWVDPVGASGAIAAATSYSATMSTHVSTTAGDMLDAFAVTNDNTTLTVPTVSQTGVTFDTVTEYPATALSSATSNDISADGCNRLATSGTSSAAAVVSGTNSVADPGAAWTTRLRILPGSTVSDSFSASAVIKTTVTPTGPTADSIVLRTQSYTATADAVISSVVVTGDFSASALLSRTQQGSATADAIVFATIEGSATADSTVLRSYAQAATADAIIRRTQTGPLTASAVILATVPNPAFWQTVFVDEGFSKFGVAYDGTGTWVVVGYGYSSSNGGAFRSVDGGQTWQGSWPFGGTDDYVRDVAYADGKWVVVGTSSSVGKIATSTDGLEWTVRDSGMPDPYSVAYGNGLWVAGGSSAVRTSTDGLTWTPASSPSGYVVDLAYGDGLWVAVGAFGIATSTDISSWDVVETSVRPRSVAFRSGTWVAAGLVYFYDGLFSSSDGETWTLRISGPWRSVAYGDRWLAMDASSGSSYALQQAESVDGLSWSVRPISPSFEPYGLAYGDGIWIAADYAAGHIKRGYEDFGLPLDAVIRREQSGGLTVDAVIAAGSTTVPGNLSADAVVRREGTGSVSADAITLRTELASPTADSVIAATVGSSLTGDAVVRATASNVASVDAIVRATPVSSLTTDAIVRREQAGSLDVSAFISRTETGSFEASSVIGATQSSSSTADSVLLREQAGALSADSVVGRTSEASVTADGAILRVAESVFDASATFVPCSFSADAYISAAGFSQFSADAVITATLAGSYTADAVFLREAAVSLTADALILRPESSSLMASALIKVVQSGSFTVDAIFLRTWYFGDGPDPR